MNNQVLVSMHGKNSYILHLYPTYQAWAELMKDIGKVKLTMQPQKKSLQKVWEWLEKYVAPSLKLFAEVGKIEKRDYIGNLVANGEMNITQKQLYDDFPE